MKYRGYAFGALILTGVWLACQASETASRPATSEPASRLIDGNESTVAMQMRTMLHPICLDAMIKIQKDLSALGTDFPIIAPIAKQAITPSSYDANFSKGMGIYYFIELKQNVKQIDRTSRDPNCDDLPQPIVDIVEKDGIKFSVIITDRRSHLDSTKIYDLRINTEANAKWGVVYYVKTNPENPKLEEAVEKIMDENVKLLDKKLEAVRALQNDTTEAKTENRK